MKKSLMDEDTHEMYVHIWESILSLQLYDYDNWHDVIIITGKMVNHEAFHESILYEYIHTISTCNSLHTHK